MNVYMYIYVCVSDAHICVYSFKLLLPIIISDLMEPSFFPLISFSQFSKFFLKNMFFLNRKKNPTFC